LRLAQGCIRRNRKKRRLLSTTFLNLECKVGMRTTREWRGNLAVGERDMMVVTIFKSSMGYGMNGRNVGSLRNSHVWRIRGKYRCHNSDSVTPVRTHIRQVALFRGTHHRRPIHRILLDPSPFRRALRSMCPRSSLVSSALFVAPSFSNISRARNASDFASSNICC